MGALADSRDLAAKVNNILASNMPVVLFIGKGCKYINPVLANKPWSCVVTSQQNENLLYDFSIEGKRRTLPILDYTQVVEKASLSQRNLNIIYLYGTEQPLALTAREKRQRNFMAAEIMKTLPDLFKGTFGYFVSINYDNNYEDEIDFGVMVDAIEGMRKGSVYFFDVKENLKSNDLFMELMSDDKIEATDGDLQEASQDIGKERDEDEYLEFSTEGDVTDVFLFVNGKRTKITAEDVFETRGFATLLSEIEIKTPDCPKYLRTEYFYKFLKDSANYPVWYGFANDFNLKRNFEESFIASIRKALEAKGDTKKSKAFVLSGQTSSSKSMTLGHLAYKIYCERHFPVVYIKNPEINLDRFGPNFLALDSLLLKLERLGASNILLVWDNASSFSQLREVEKLLISLRNLGRKVVITCSSYQQDMSRWKNFFIETSSEILLTPGEHADLKKIVLRNSDISEESFDRWVDKIPDRNLLTLLYNLLREHIGSQLVRGLGREAGIGMDALFENLNNISDGATKTALNTMAEALENAGYKLSDFSNSDDDGIKALDLANKIRGFFITVAVAAQYKIALPIFMALRRLQLSMDNYFALVQRSLFNVPCLKVFPVQNNDADLGEFVSFRTPLEASLFLQDAIVNPELEIDYIVRLILDTASAGIYSRSSESATVEKIIRAIGPNSDQRSKYQNFYPRIIDALSQLRRKFKIYDIRLISQEVTWLREIYGSNHSCYDNFTDSLRKEKLLEAIKLAKDSVSQQVAPAFKNNLNLHNLIVERVLCELRLDEIANRGAVADNNKSVYFDYRDLWFQLKLHITQDPTNTYLRNTLMKLFFKIYDGSSIDVTEKAKYLSDILSIVDFIDSQWGYDFDDEEYNGHVLRLKRIESDDAYSEYFQELIEKNSAIGVYLKARSIINDKKINIKIDLREDQVTAIEEVIRIIESYSPVTKMHSGCQYLLLRLVWLLHNKKPIFSGHDMQRTEMSTSQWREIEGICRNYEQQFMSGDDLPVNAPTLYYLLALSNAQLGDFASSRSFFKLIEAKTVLHRPIRNKVWHLICDDKGNLKKFKGALDGDSYNVIQKKGYIRVAEIGRVYFYGPNLKVSNYRGAFQDVEIGTSYVGFEAFRKLGE